MTLTTRNTVLIILLVLTIAFTFLSFFGGYLYTQESFDDAQLQRRLTAGLHYLFLSWEQPGVDLPQVFVGILSLSAVAIVGTTLVLRYFRRTNAPEVFLFSLFLVSLAGDNLKLAVPLLILLDQPPLYGVILTRIVQFCHLFGVFVLFASTLFGTGMDYQRLGTISIVAFFLALAMTYTMPVDSLRLYPSLVYQMGDHLTIQLVIAALVVLSVVNVVNAAVLHGGENLALYGGAVFLMFVGRELTFLLSGYVTTAIGIALLVIGAASYGVRKYMDYLWV